MILHCWHTLQKLFKKVLLMKNEQFKYYTVKQRIFDFSLFAFVVMFFSYAFACAIVGELIGFN